MVYIYIYIFTALYSKKHFRFLSVSKCCMSLEFLLQKKYSLNHTDNDFIFLPAFAMLNNVLAGSAPNVDVVTFLTTVSVMSQCS